MKNRLVAAAFAPLLVSLAPAQARDRGLYIGFQQGLTLPSTLTAPLSGNSQPTRCDSLLYPSGMVTATDCPAGGTRPIYSTDFDLGVGDSSAIQIGYDWGRVRLEAEYLLSFPGSDSSLIFASDDPVALGKSSEWNVDAPPFARVSDVRTDQLFANVYYDFENDSPWTPFVGAGAGTGCVCLDYSNRYVRKTIAQGFYPAGGVDPATAATIPDWQRNAAGTVSAVDTRVSNTVFGFQVLGGVDRALSERVSLGVHVRWVRFAATYEESSGISCGATSPCWSTASRRTPSALR